jgi:hypothetical protein
MYRNLSADKMTLASAFHVEEVIDFDAILAQYKEYAAKLAPMVCDTAYLLNTAIKAARRFSSKVPGDDARCGSRHVSVCDLVQRNRGRRLRRHGSRPNGSTA